MSQVSNPPNPDSDHKTRLILGCGYVGMRIASRWLKAGDKVIATTRSQLRAAELEKLSIEPWIWNWLDSEPIPTALLDTFKRSSPETILVAVSHSSSSHARGLAHLADSIGCSSSSFNSPSCSSFGLDSQSPPTAVSKPRWIYLSTTGVFADNVRADQATIHGLPGENLNRENLDRENLDRENFNWVDESSPVGPTRPGSINALEAERWLENSGLEHVVLRPAGIYGPDRIPNLQPIRDAIALGVDPESYLNLIHVDDLAEVIAAVAQGPLRHRLYCVSDGQSVRRKDYYAYIAQSMGYPEPTYGLATNRDLTNTESTQNLVPRRRSEGNKRVRNDLLISDYSIEFRFPNYRHGLSSLLGESSR